MTTNNWREEFEKITTSSYASPFNFDKQCKKELYDFIETQIAQAEQRGEEKMKNKILKIIPCETAKSQLNTMAQNDRIDDENLLLWQIRHGISCLGKDYSISSL